MFTGPVKAAPALTPSFFLERSSPPAPGARRCLPDAGQIGNRARRPHADLFQLKNYCLPYTAADRGRSGKEKYPFDGGARRYLCMPVMDIGSGSKVIRAVCFEPMAPFV